MPASKSSRNLRYEDPHMARGLNQLVTYNGFHTLLSPYLISYQQTPIVSPTFLKDTKALHLVHSEPRVDKD